ncbi:MAG: hypothetical protein IH945_10680, partial [Armatimonadetes bacterium]|nr:hypothetical protein [Armatimonadota bacterium]
HLLRDPGGDGTYVVFGTPLTTQGYGEFVFEYRNGLLQRQLDESDARGYKALHYDFDLRFRTARKEAQIAVTVRLERAAGAASHVHFRLSPHYQVSLVTDAEGNLLQYRQASGVVSVAPPLGPSPVVKMTYTGVVNLPRFAGAIVRDEVMLTNDYWWPMVARGPATVTTTAHVPQDWTVVTHGKKTKDQTTSGERTVTFRMDVPISYLSFSAGKFRHVEKKVGRITYHVWSRRMQQAQMQAQLELMPPVIQFYERFALYPFEDFGALVTELYGGGALEAYSYATYGAGLLPREDAHEPAHTWWGGLVPNTYLDSYWNESFAVFSDGLFDREVPIGNTEERRQAFVRHHEVTRAYQQAAVASAGAYDSRNASTLGYGKGAAVLQQLEREIGTDKMIIALKDWIAGHPAGEPSGWEQFETSLSKTLGEDMAWFFDQWVRGKGAPSFEITGLIWNFGEVIADVRFTGSPYRLTTEVYAELADGTTQTVDVVLNPDKVTGKSEFRFKLASRPRLISFDPFDRVVMERRSTDPPSLRSALSKMKPVGDRRYREYLATFSRYYNRRQLVYEQPRDPSGYFLIGHPDTMPVMKKLCERVGFDVAGDSLTYKGTTIDLREGAAFAIVDLGGGKTCGIGLGRTQVAPNPGAARLCLTDNYGRFVRGKTEPRTKGKHTFRMP